MKNPQLKKKIEFIVEDYIANNELEYHSIVYQIQMERELNKDKFASIATDKNVKRKIFEIPETLHNMIVNELDPDELALTKDGEDGVDYAKWFANRFPEFKSGELV